MDPSIVKKKSKKRKAPAPPNPFTGEVEEVPHEAHVSDDEEGEEVQIISYQTMLNKIKYDYQV